MRIFSGIQPSGTIHIGNYLGALKQWVELQKKAECIFCIVDLHAITVPYQPKKLQENILDAAICYLAVGINPEKSILFIQSKVKEHSELAWLLNTITPMGELQRMTQYKDKFKQFKGLVGAGLINYPVLMAADILLYQTDIVPVGKDQKQHVELTATIAKKFNAKFGKTFKIPRTYIPKTGAKIMSLNNPKKKMSKSLGPASYISLFDEPAVIKKKVMSAVTDTGRKIKYDPKKNLCISNLIIIYSFFSDKPIKKLEKDFSSKGYSEFKKSLVNLLTNSLKPFRDKRKELIKRKVYVKEILRQGTKKAQNIAGLNISDIKKKMGLI